MYTEFIETGSLSAYARLCGLRLDPHAQVEIQVYAEAVSKLLKEKFPVSWNALVTHGLGLRTLLHSCDTVYRDFITLRAN
jgi:thymidylate synthase ThyX